MIADALIELLLTLALIFVYGLLPAVMLAGLISSIRRGQPNLDQPWQAQSKREPHR